MTGSPPPSNIDGNYILATLDKAESRQFFSQLESVSLSQGDMIYEPDGRIDYVYFPDTAIFSMLATMSDGSTVEVGPVGHEGLVGLRVFLGARMSRYQVIVHVEGHARRMKADSFRAALNSDNFLITPPLLRYTQMLLSMTGQSTACNKRHVLDQQLARWLLMMRDYVGDELSLTHELMALTLGVRRAGISTAANEFKQAGLIDYQRGHIQIINGQGLEAVACECYGEVKEEYESLYADLAGMQSTRDAE
jgi:CRP-like cAMP-binding protein